MEQSAVAVAGRAPWNKGKLVGQKAPLKLKEIWAIRIRLQMSAKARDLALFNLAIDSKLRACDLVKIRVHDVSHGDWVTPRAIVMQQKTQRAVQFELTEATRGAIGAWIARTHLRTEDFLFPSRVHSSPHLSTRQYARIADSWVCAIGLNLDAYGAHTMRTDRGIADLPTREEPEGGAAVVGPYRAGKHGTVSGNRSRRCPIDGRTD
jgi:integrase